MKPFVALWLLVCVVSPSLGAELAREQALAPAFRLPLYNAQPGQAASLGIDVYVGPKATDAEAKLVLVSFMASFCEPCKKELPQLQRLHEELSPKGLRVISISIDKEPQGQKTVEQLLSENKITFPVLKDRFGLVARRWLGAQSALPSVFFVDREGTILSAKRGYEDDAGALLSSTARRLLEAKSK